MAFLILISICNNNVSAGNDKLKHFGVSAVFGAGIESYLHYGTSLEDSERIILSTTLGTLPGLIKEFIDSTKEGNRFSGGDLAADFGGALLGALAGNFINNFIQIKMDIDKTQKNVVFTVSYKF